MENIIIRAAMFADQAHRGQVRKYSGKPYILHPEAVAGYLMRYGSDEDVVAAGWLHDVVEDCGILVNDLMWGFGGNVADLVDQVSNPSRAYPHLPRRERKRIDREHIANASPDAQLIKVVDRRLNLEDIPKDDSFYEVYVNESKLLGSVLLKVNEVELKKLYDLF